MAVFTLKYMEIFKYFLTKFKDKNMETEKVVLLDEYNRTNIK
jgi:hypothetical protein